MLYLTDWKDIRLHSACSLEIISQIKQPASSVSLIKNQPTVLSASQISPSEQADY
jgi:hypothetical protein